jgi:hypothetical protein
MTGNDQVAEDWLSKRYYDRAAKAIRTAKQRLPAVYWRGDFPGQWYYLDSQGGS